MQPTQTVVLDAAMATILSEVKSGQGIGLSEACKLFPPFRPGQRTHPATLTRWIQFGVRGLNGNKIKLDAVRCGSRWITTAGAIERFLIAQQQQPINNDQPTDRTPRQRNAAAEAAIRELEAMGA